MPKLEEIITASIACSDIDEAVRPIQDFLDVEDGGVATLCLEDCANEWSEMSPADRHKRLAAYIHSEILWMTPH